MAATGRMQAGPLYIGRGKVEMLIGRRHSGEWRRATVGGDKPTQRGACAVDFREAEKIEAGIEFVSIQEGMRHRRNENTCMTRPICTYHGFS